MPATVPIAGTWSGSQSGRDHRASRRISSGGYVHGLLDLERDPKKETERLDSRRNIFLGAIAIFGVLNLSSVFSGGRFAAKPERLFKSPTAIGVEFALQLAIYCCCCGHVRRNVAMEKRVRKRVEFRQARVSAVIARQQRQPRLSRACFPRNSAGVRVSGGSSTSSVDAQRREPAADQPCELLPDFFGHPGRQVSSTISRGTIRRSAAVPGPARPQAVAQVRAGLLPARALDRCLVARRRR